MLAVIRTFKRKNSPWSIGCSSSAGCIGPPDGAPDTESFRKKHGVRYREEQKICERRTFIVNNESVRDHGSQSLTFSLIFGYNEESL